MRKKVIHETLTIGTFLFVIIFAGCSENVAPFENVPDIKTIKTATTEQALIEPIYSEPDYPQYAETVARYVPKWGQYHGATLRLANGSSFWIVYGALTAPDHLHGKHVTITMQVEKNALKNELIYTFGPSGSQFDPHAEIWLKWEDLGIGIPTLYYMDDAGNRVEHLPDNIDVYNKQMCIYIDHFSRYAMAYSD